MSIMFEVAVLSLLMLIALNLNDVRSVLAPKWTSFTAAMIVFWWMFGMIGVVLKTIRGT